ncbi:porin [Pelagovum pacificum]|uniref:Porin n=1 Tax=Pelagovum pacificum TaxID=2588711 RepID=A0A5C5GJY3_9RHOB|nr:porin [Pelagovum pacificum]QQA43081.1 porin [Pelagovum pacificum]TNY33776.1 porin [Pelagovum pacificum]
MKRILLASSALVAFAGAAAAEVTFTGSATLGYNDTDAVLPGDDPSTAPAIETGFDTIDDDNVGYYWDVNIGVMLSQELDNGLTAAVEFNFDAVDGDLGSDLEAADYVLSLTSESGGMYFGKTDFAAQTYWMGVGDMEYDGFSEADGETVLRSEVIFGSVTFGTSYIINDDVSADLNFRADSDADGDFGNDEDAFARNGDEVVQLSLGATAEFGQFSVGMAYQEAIDNGNLSTRLLNEDTNDDGLINGADSEVIYNDNGDISADEIFGIYGMTSFAGADVSLAFAQNNTVDENSLGFGVSYPIGPVVAGFAYVSNSDVANTYELSVGYSTDVVTADFSYSDNEDGTDQEYSLDGRYNVGSGLAILAGLHGGEDNTNELDYYVAGEYDLGGGAMIVASYAEDDDSSEEDEIGSPEFQEGTTVEFTFEF